MIRFLFAVVELVGMLLHPTLAALLTAGLLQATGFIGIRSVLVWALAAPAIYVVWLLILVGLYALETRLFSSLNVKPRRISSADAGSLLPLIGLARLYRRAAMLASLPLAPSLVRIPLLRTLAYRTYASSVHIGQRVVLYGDLFDPDLTHIGDHAVIGANASVVAHTMTTEADGSLVYASAPIRIGRAAVVGGESFVGMGATIGDGSVVELCSNVAPFTVIPPGEVWGGNPAVFRRKRSDATTSEPARSPAPVGSEAIRQLVVAALDLPDDETSGSLSRESCARWDSLGQMAIAAALFDRYGVKLEPETVFGLNTLADVEQASRASEGSEATLELPPDPELLPLLDSSSATRALAQTKQLPEAAMRLAVVVAGSFVCEPLATSLKLWSRAFGIETDVTFCDFNQVAQSLLSPDSPFRGNPRGMNVVLMRPEDLPGTRPDERADSAEGLLQAIERFVAEVEGTLVVGTLPPPVSAHFAVGRSELDRLRAEWGRRLAGHEKIEVLDFAAVVERVGTAEAGSVGFDVVARAPYSARAYQELGIELARLVRRRSGLFPPAKVVALDCDGTLWGGVVGEDGPSGLELGPEGRGRAFQLFQRQLLELKQRGLLLALVTRNEERDVWDVFDNHPEMVLKRQDIAAWRINWNDKSDNLRQLAEELNLGLDAFVFADDDPAVRLEVQARAPQIKVLPMPAEPERYVETLSRLWLFDRATATAEDQARTRMILEERERRQAQQASEGLESYLRDLQLQVEIEPPADADLPRVAQLTQKTNQFNLSLRRRNLDEVRSLGPDVEVRIVRARDRFGDYGTIGLAFLGPAEADPEAQELDTFLMSCRALGRGIEQAFVHHLFALARERGARRVRAPFVQGPRNQPVLGFLERSGWQREGDLFQWSLDEDVAFPSHIACEPQPAKPR